MGGGAGGAATGAGRGAVYGGAHSARAGRGLGRPGGPVHGPRAVRPGIWEVLGVLPEQPQLCRGAPLLHGGQSLGPGQHVRGGAEAGRAGQPRSGAHQQRAEEVRRRALPAGRRGLARLRALQRAGPGRAHRGRQLRPPHDEPHPGRLPAEHLGTRQGLAGRSAPHDLQVARLPRARGVQGRGLQGDAGRGGVRPVLGRGAAKRPGLRVHPPAGRTWPR